MYQKNVYNTRQSTGTTQRWADSSVVEMVPVESTTNIFTPTTAAQLESLMALDNELTVSSNYSSDDESSQDVQMNYSNTKTRCLPGPKSSIRTEEMTPEDIRRRQRRRERNKLAAARCRQRRIDITNQLLTETQQLEAEGQRLQREIENLRRQKEQLQFVLDAHQPTCRSEIPAINVESTQANVTIGQPVRPSTLPINSQITTSEPAALSFDLLTSTIFTPVVTSSGISAFLGTGSDFVSPTTLLLSPTSLIVQ